MSGSESYEALRKALVERRIALGYGQRKLGERMETAQSNVSALESGKTRSPGIDVIMRWAEGLHTKLTFHLEPEEAAAVDPTPTPEKPVEGAPDDH